MEAMAGMGSKVLGGLGARAAGNLIGNRAGQNDWSQPWGAAKTIAPGLGRAENRLAGVFNTVKSTGDVIQELFDPEAAKKKRLFADYDEYFGDLN